jgi:hypothetical protein
MGTGALYIMGAGAGCIMGVGTGCIMGVGTGCIMGVGTGCIIGAGLFTAAHARTGLKGGKGSGAGAIGKIATSPELTIAGDGAGTGGRVGAGAECIIGAGLFTAAHARTGLTGGICVVDGKLVFTGNTLDSTFVVTMGWFPIPPNEFAL